MGIEEAAFVAGALIGFEIGFVIGLFAMCWVVTAVQERQEGTDPS